VNKSEPLGIRLLLVEDDPDDAILTKALLKEAGLPAVVKHATTPEAALEELKKGESPEIVIVDYLLGEKTGTELAQELRAQGYQGPILLLTGQTERELIDEALNAGLSDYLVKGKIDAHSLERSIRYAIERDRVEKEKDIALAALRESEERYRQLASDLEKRVEERTAELESMSYSLAHDMRQYVRGISVNAGMLADELRGNLPTEQIESLERLESNAQHMHQMVEAILGHLRYGRAAVQKLDLDISAMASEVVDLLAKEGVASFGSSEITIESGMKAKGDPTLVRTLLQALLHNAWLYARKDGVLQVDVGFDTPRAAFFVSDHGSGFDPKYAERIFRPFERLHGDELPGTGIGLANARRIMQRHGGDLTVETSNSGTTFWFDLPTA